MDKLLRKYQSVNVGNDDQQQQQTDRLSADGMSAVSDGPTVTSASYHCAIARSSAIWQRDRAARYISIETRGPSTKASSG